MSLVTVIWSMTVSASLTLAAISFLVWYKRRTAWAGLLFTLASTGVAIFAGCEVWMMRAETPTQFGTALRWIHVPTWVIILSLVGFVRLYLRAGRPWLAWTICVLRTVALPLNFLVGQNLNYLEVTSLRHISLFGEPVSVGEGVSNPWMLVGQLSLLLFVVFAADATITVWRRGDRRLAVVIGGSIVVCMLVGTLQAVLVLWQIVNWPITTSLFFMAVVMAMGYEMSRDTLRAAQLSDDLIESEERMTLATEAAGFGVWMWSIDRNQIWGSDRWLKMFGFAPDAVVPFEEFLQRIHPEDRELVERGVRHALEARVDYRGEYRVMLPDGAQRWLVSRGRMHPDAQRKPARMMGVALDITERKQAEQESVQHRNELAHVARVSTMGQLASSLAHEINQPLGAILRNAEAAELFLQEPSPDIDEIRAILADIREDDQRAGEVIDRMRGLIKRREIERCPLDLHLLAGEVVRLVRPDAEMRRVRLVIEPGPVLPPVQGDRVQLQQVMLNLLINAMDAVKDNPPAKRLVTVSAQPTSANIEVSVSDNGQGISADQLVRVFEPFFTSKPNGLGMGLAISRSIIEAHGGQLWAESGPGGGAVFRFVLPVGGAGHGEQ
jgi:PAS domain S-box-containing protein